MPSDPLVRLLRSDRLSPTVPYAYAATTEAPPRLVFTAGACPLDARSRTVAVGDVAGQTEQVMANLRAALQVAGAELTDVLMTHVYGPAPRVTIWAPRGTWCAATSATTTRPAPCWV